MIILGMSNSFYSRKDERVPFTETFSVEDSAAKGKERVSIVAICSLIASLSLFSAGFAVAFTSPTLLELSNENLTIPSQFINASSFLPSVFGVSR